MFKNEIYKYNRKNMNIIINAIIHNAVIKIEY